MQQRKHNYLIYNFNSLAKFHAKRLFFTEPSKRDVVPWRRKSWHFTGKKQNEMFTR